MEGQEGNHGAISAQLDYTAPAPPGARLWDGQDVAHGARRTMGPSWDPPGAIPRAKRREKGEQRGEHPNPQICGVGMSPRVLVAPPCRHPAASRGPPVPLLCFNSPCPTLGSDKSMRRRGGGRGGGGPDTAGCPPASPLSLFAPISAPRGGRTGLCVPLILFQPPLAQQLSAPCHRDAGTEMENLGACWAASHRPELGDVSGSLPSLPAPRGEEGKAPATSPIARAPSRPLPLFRFSPCHVGSSGNRQEVKTQHEARGCAQLPLNPSAPSSPSPGTDLG